MYYVYKLIDPRNNQPFYIGKGTGNRWKAHLRETAENTSNWYKYCKIKGIKDDKLEVICEFIAKDIEDEEAAYDIEAEYIKIYGTYSNGGILCNKCDDNRPPNHKGKSYFDLYGEDAEEQRIKRRDRQRSVGGYRKGIPHTEETKLKLSQISAGSGNGHSYDISEEEMLKIGIDFCRFFNYNINNKKWLYYISTLSHRIPNRRSYRFNRRDLLDILIKEHGAKRKHSPLLWFNNPLTGEIFRCTDWELDLSIVQVPDGYVRGRGKGNFVKKKQETENTHYIIGGIKHDIMDDTFKDFEL